MSQVTVRCQYCERLFLMERPLFIDEQKRATCPAYRREARENTEKMTERPKDWLKS